MNELYQIIKSVLDSKDYNLTTYLNKIEAMWARDQLDDSQREELIELARTNADPTKSYADYNTQIASLSQELNERVTKLEENQSTILEILEALKDGKSTDVEVPTDDTKTEDVAEYKPPTGAHDAYQVGDKVKFNERIYECVLANCVWDPKEYPSAWKDITE